MRKYLFFAIAATVLVSCSKPEMPSVPNEEIVPNTIITYQSFNGKQVIPHYYNYDTTTFGAIIISNTFQEGSSVAIGTIKFDRPITQIGDNAFYGTYIRSITIPDSVTYIGDYAFRATYLARITLPDSVKSIGKYAFCATSLTSITLPDSVISIGAYAFASNDLFEIILPDSITSIEEGTFSNCFSLRSIIFGRNILTIGNEAFSSTNLSGVEIPDSVISIGAKAFENCEWLGRVVLGKGVKTIGKNAFGKCKRLLEVYCKAQEPPVLGSETALGDPQNSVNYKIYVPQGAVDAYKSAWNNYSEYIVGYDFNAL